MKQIALGEAVAVLVDATVVRAQRRRAAAVA